MLRRSVSVSLRPRDILKLTFLFLATFVQARLLPAQAEKALRACTQCRKSALGADLTSFVKCSAQRAQCNAYRVPCTVASRAMHGAFCALQRVFGQVGRVDCSPHRAPRTMHGVACTPRRVPRFTSFGDCRMQHVFWQKHRATWIAASVPCAPLSGRCKTRNGECIMPTASCIPPSA